MGQRGFRSTGAGQRGPWLARIPAVVAAFALLSSCTGSDASGNAGPLEFTAGNFAGIMYPLNGPSFMAFPGCVEGDAKVVTIRDLRPKAVTGADEADIEFAAAWPEQNEPLKYASGTISEMEDAFGEWKDTSGQVESCDSESSVTGLEVAVLLPEPSEQAVVVEGFVIDYAIAGEEFSQHVTATVGMCAATPFDPAGEPPECVDR